MTQKPFVLCIKMHKGKIDLKLFVQLNTTVYKANSGRLIGLGSFKIILQLCLEDGK
jgi:hypothetical protein